MSNKNLAVEFTTDFKEAFFNQGEKGIRNVATQYIFGTKQMFNGQFDRSNDKESIAFVDSFVCNLKSLYNKGGEELVLGYVEGAIQHGI
jgi:hypothetical protein